MLADEATANNEAAARPRRARHAHTRTASSRAAEAPFLTIFFAFLLFRHHRQWCKGTGTGLCHAQCRVAILPPQCTGLNGVQRENTVCGTVILII